jgi:hypothetical protein
MGKENNTTANTDNKINRPGLLRQSTDTADVVVMPARLYDDSRTGRHEVDCNDLKPKAPARAEATLRRQCRRHCILFQGIIPEITR